MSQPNASQPFPNARAVDCPQTSRKLNKAPAVNSTDWKKKDRMQLRTCMDCWWRQAPSRLAPRTAACCGRRRRSAEWSWTASLAPDIAASPNTSACKHCQPSRQFYVVLLLRP